MNQTFPTLEQAAELLGAAFAVYFVLVFSARILRLKRGARFGWAYHAFALAAGLLAGFMFSSWSPSWKASALPEMSGAVILLATLPVIALVNRVLWTRATPDGRRADAPRLLADTTGLVIFLAVALTVLQGVFGVHVTVLLAGSGVLAIVLGLAMQDLLGNILAGFALYISQPFKAGDWLLVDNYHARVVEVTWRSTRLITEDDVILEVPNNDLVKRPIINFHQPDPVHALRVTMGLHYSVPPAHVQEVLAKAAISASGVCEKPPPQVNILNFADSSIVYEIKFWIRDHAEKNRISSEVRSHCWYAVRRAGIEIPFPTITLLKQEVGKEVEQARAAAVSALRAHSIFSFLPAEQIEELTRQSSVVLFAKGEPLVEQGAEGESMFLVVRGSVEVRVQREGVSTVVTQLGPGDCLGEMALLTGEKRSATVVVACQEVEAVEITKDTFSAFIRHHPEIINRLGDLLVQRQTANQEIASSNFPRVPQEEQRASLLRRLRSFFQLGS